MLLRMWQARPRSGCGLFSAACLRVQACQRRPRHSRHPSLSRPPIDYVHGPLHGLDPEPLQKLRRLAGNFCRTYQKLSTVTAFRAIVRITDPQFVQGWSYRPLRTREGRAAMATLRLTQRRTLTRRHWPVEKPPASPVSKVLQA